MLTNFHLKYKLLSELGLFMQLLPTLLGNNLGKPTILYIRTYFTILLTSSLQLTQTIGMSLEDIFKKEAHSDRRKQKLPKRREVQKKGPLWTGIRVCDIGPKLPQSSIQECGFLGIFPALFAFSGG
jgi:hypothetical protein